MTTITIADAEEAGSSGYYTITIEENGEAIAIFSLAPAIMPDFDTPEQIEELGEAIQQWAKLVGEMDHA